MVIMTTVPPRRPAYASAASLTTIGLYEGVTQVLKLADAHLIREAQYSFPFGTLIHRGTRPKRSSPFAHDDYNSEAFP
jgi:hypothetical protein